MARVYATIANGGFMIDPYLITEVRDVDGKVFDAATPKHACLDCSVTSPDAAPGDTVAAPPAANAGTENLAPRTIDPQVDWLIADMMHDVAVRGTGAKTNELHRNDLAGKTGTTNDETDAWFNGFQATQVAIAWVGFDQPAPLRSEEHTSELQSLMRISYAVFCLKKKKTESITDKKGEKKDRQNKHKTNNID